MESIKSIARFWVVIVGIFLILTGISLLFNVAVPVVLMGVLALVAGIFALFAS